MKRNLWTDIRYLWTTLHIILDQGVLVLGLCLRGHIVQMRGFLVYAYGKIPPGLFWLLNHLIKMARIIIYFFVFSLTSTTYQPETSENIKSQNIWIFVGTSLGIFITTCFVCILYIVCIKGKTSNTIFVLILI